MRGKRNLAGMESDLKKNEQDVVQNYQIY